MPTARRLFGDAGERAAEQELIRRGLRVLARNARTRYGELDLVCHDGNGFVFVEVKTRRGESFVQAIEAIDGRKLDRLTRLAEAWLALHGLRAAQWRVVLLAVTVHRDRTVAELIETA